MKKIIVAVLGLVLALGNMLTASADFKDVALGHKNVQAIQFLQDAGVIGGFTDGTFKPAEKLNRAQLMKILVEGQGITPDEEVYENCFTDVQAQWYAPYVCYAKELGWVEGFEDGSFKPERPVNKVQAVKMTIESQGFAENKEVCNRELFADTEVSKWYGKYLCVALQKGLLEEDENGNYVPANDMTRAQVAENIYRAILIKRLDKAAYTDEVKGMVKEALDVFKAEKEGIKAHMDSFKEDLKQMKVDGATNEEVKIMREDFWGVVKDAQKQNTEDLKGKIKEARDLFHENKSILLEQMKDCKGKGLEYGFMVGECKVDVEKGPVNNQSIEGHVDDDDQGVGNQGGDDDVPGVEDQDQGDDDDLE